jgi:dipeptidyl aminopeptidase/acylaminoacyl peptidase
MVQQFDLGRGTLIGDPVRLADPVGISAIGQINVSISRDGRVAYRSGGVNLRQLTWYDRSGKSLGAVEEPDADLVLYPELSPDDQHVAAARTKLGNQNIWIQDFMRGGMTLFTTDPANDFSPLWAPDGRIAFSSLRKGGGLYAGPSSRASAEVPLLETTNRLFAEDWSKDGRFLLYSEANPKTGRDLWVLPMSGSRASGKERFVVVNTPADELNGQLSPNGQWMAYETNESGRFEIVVQPFPNVTSTWQVSVNGGVQPRWRADGKELYFVAADGKLMASSITTGAKFEAGRPIVLFPARVVPGAGANKQQYAVSRDGRFLINQPVEESTAPITLILNWHPESGK